MPEEKIVKPVREAFLVGGICSAIIAAIMLAGLYFFVEGIDPFSEGNDLYFWGILGWAVMIGCFCGVDRFQQASTRVSHKKQMTRWNIDV